jgi:UDPglucose--hexose-1-phosphate uridylyltransferase
MQHFNHNEHPHRRYNPLLDEWILVSPHRAKRPWQGQNETLPEDNRPEHDETCYLCAGNVRANGIKNEDYTNSYVFENDFSALLKDDVLYETKNNSLFQLKPERGINKVVCFSPKHNLTLPEMEVSDIEKVVQTSNWAIKILSIMSKYLKTKEVLWVVAIHIHTDKFGRNLRYRHK